MEKISFAKKVYAVCRKIPKGKVSTYGEIARVLGIKSSRTVGQALRCNKHPNTIPCFKIIKSTGEVGGYFGSNPGNIERKIKKLSKEGIFVERSGKIDLKKHLFIFK